MRRVGKLLHSSHECVDAGDVAGALGALRHMRLGISAPEREGVVREALPLLLGEMRIEALV
jgi:hypothetical protein